MGFEPKLVERKPAKDPYSIGTLMCLDDKEEIYVDGKDLVFKLIKFREQHLKHRIAMVLEAYDPKTWETNQTA